MMKSCSCPWSSREVMPPILAPVRERAPSTIPRNTTSRSRVSMMRRLAWLSRDRRSPGSAYSCPGLSAWFKAKPSRREQM